MQIGVDMENCSPCIYLSVLRNRLAMFNDPKRVPQRMIDFSTYEIVDIPSSWWSPRRSINHGTRAWVIEEGPNPLEFIWPDKLIGKDASREERREYIRREYTIVDGMATCESAADYWLGEFQTQYGNLRKNGKEFLINKQDLPYFVIVRDVVKNCWKDSLHVTEWINENIKHHYTIWFEGTHKRFEELGYTHKNSDHHHKYDAMFFFHNRDEFFDFCKFWKAVPEYWVMENIEEAKELIDG